MGSIIDAAHALVMALWIIGLPLLFWHRYPALSKAYALYAICFIGLSQLSHYILGECFLTKLATFFWQRSGDASTNEWFTVRFSKAIFNLIPTHREVTIAFEVGMIVTIAGSLYVLYRKNRHESH